MQAGLGKPAIKMRSTNSNVLITKNHDTGEVEITVTSKLNKDHNVKLHKAIELLTQGHSIEDLRNMGQPIKVERRDGDWRCIVIWSKSDERIMGDYNVRTGELIWNNYVGDHGKAYSEKLASWRKPS